MDCSLPGSSVCGTLQARILECVAYPSSRGSSQPRDQPRSPSLQADSLAEPQGKPKNTGVGSLSLLQQIFPTLELNWGFLHCRRILYCLSHQGSHVHAGGFKDLVSDSLLFSFFSHFHHCCGFHYYRHADNFQMSVSSQDLSLNSYILSNCLVYISTWISNKHLNFTHSKLNS